MRSEKRKQKEKTSFTKCSRFCLGSFSCVNVYLASTKQAKTIYVQLWLKPDVESISLKLLFLSLQKFANNYFQTCDRQLRLF